MLGEIQEIDIDNSNSIDKEELDVAAKEGGFLSKEENLVAIAKQLEGEQKDTFVQSFQECLSTAYKDIQKKTEKTKNDMAIVRVVEQLKKMGVSIVDTKELYKENHYEYKSSKLYLNNNPVDIQTMPILGNQEILEEMYKEKLAKFEIIWSIVEKFAMALQIQDSERMFNREQKPVIEKKIKKLEYILQQKEQYSSGAMLTYTDTKAFNAQIQSSLSEIFDTELLNVNNYGPIYKKIKLSCEDVLKSAEKTNKEDGIFKSFADIKGDVVVEIRKLTGRKNSEDMLLPDLEDYILQNKKLKDLGYSNKVFRRNASTKQWEDKYTKNYVIETPVAHTFDLFNNIIKPQFEEDNNPKILDDFIIASKTPSKIPTFLSGLRNQKASSESSKWENLPKNFQANVIKYTTEYSTKLQKKLEEQYEEIKKNIRKTIGGQMYIEYLQTTAPQEKKDLLLQKNKEKLIKIVESVSDTYAQYGSFRKLRSDDTTNALMGIENNRKKNGILQNEEQKIEDIYKATERQGAYKVLKSAIVRGAIETYQTEITGKGDFGLHKEKFAAAGVADFMAKGYALQKRGEDILMVPIAPDDEKIKTYMDIIGVGALDFSDKTVDEIVKRSKELAIQIALISISGGLANITTKGLMYLASVTIGKFGATTVAESIVLYYTEKAVLNRGTKMAIGAVDLATEGSLFHMFNTVLGGTVNGQSWTEMSKELKNVSGYISSIAFIGVMKMYGSLGQLATKSISDSKIVSQWIKNGTITQDQLHTVIQTFSVPLEVGTMTMTEITINFTEAAITGEEIRPIDLTNTIAIVLGLRMAHAGGNLFKKGEEIIIESMKKNKETGEWDISFRTKNTIKVDTEAVNTADVEMKNKQAEQTKMKEKEIIRVNNLLQKPFTGITLQDRHDMGFKQQREYIKKNELWKDKTLSSEEVNKKQKLEDLTVEEFGILIERIVEKKGEVNGDIVSDNIIANKDWSTLTTPEIQELYIKGETAKTELGNLLKSKAITKQEYIKQLQILEREYPTIADIISAKERGIIKKYGYEISKEKIQDYIQKLGVDIQGGGSNAQGVHEIMGTNLVAVIKSEGSFAYELPQKSLIDGLTTSRVPRIVDVFLYEGKTYKIMEKSPGKSVEKLSLEEIKNIPQEHYDNYVRDLKELETVGLQVDPSKASNVFYDKETGFHFIDLGIKESTISIFDNIKNLQLGKGILNGKQIQIAEKNAEYEKKYVVEKKGEKKSTIDPEIVKANAALEDGPRLQRAEELLGKEFTGKLIKPDGAFTQLGQKILDAHNNSKGGEVYKITKEQLLEKLRILSKAGFTSEQVRVLMRNGLCGKNVREKIVTLLNPIKKALSSDQLDLVLSGLEKISPSDTYKYSENPEKLIDFVYKFVDSLGDFNVSDVTSILGKLNLLKSAVAGGIEVYSDRLQIINNIEEVRINSRLNWKKRINKGFDIMEAAGVSLDEGSKAIMHKAIIRAHVLGHSELGKNGEYAHVYNYTIKQLGQKMYILMDAMQKCGIDYQVSKNIAKELLRKGICGEDKGTTPDIHQDGVSNSKNAEMVKQKISEGNKIKNILPTKK